MHHLEYLEWNYLVPNTIKVQVTDGWITLNGSAEWRYQKEEAEMAVRLLKGVKGVFNEIAVTPKVGAVDVKIKIENALKRNAEIEARQITVEAAESKVTVRGHVRSWGGAR